MKLPINPLFAAQQSQKLLQNGKRAAKPLHRKLKDQLMLLIKRAVLRLPLLTHQLDADARDENNAVAAGIGNLLMVQIFANAGKIIIYIIAQRGGAAIRTLGA